MARRSVTLAAGASFLTSEEGTQYWLTDPDTQFRLEITDLPANSHLKQIVRSDTGEKIGEYRNLDVWTSDYGNFITSVTAKDNGKQLLFADGVHAWCYQIKVSGGAASAVPVELPALETASLTDAPLQVYPFYAVQGDKVYSRSGGLVTVTGSLGGGMQLMENADFEVALKSDLSAGITMAEGSSLTIETDKVYTIPSITSTGDSQVTLKGFGVTIDESGGIQVGTLTMESGSVTVPFIRGGVNVLGGSLKTDQPLIGVQGENGALCLAVVPLQAETTRMARSNEMIRIKVDGTEYPGITGSGHGDGKMYLYVSTGARYLEAGDSFYYLSYQTDSQTMELLERQDGNGEIDLSEGSAEILSKDEYGADDLYLYNGRLYRNTNGDKYVITGKTESHTLTVSGGSPKITVRDLEATADPSKGGSPINLASGVSATIVVEGKNMLTGAEGRSLIHVPEGASLTLEGNGSLSAEGGLYGAVIGGDEGEASGKITFCSGTFNLYGNGTAAVGAGLGATPAKNSIVILGGSLKAVNSLGGSGLGTTPVNGDGDSLVSLAFVPDSMGKVQIDGKEWAADTLNDDGKLYLYLIAKVTEITVDGDEYLAAPLKIRETEHGTIAAYLQDGTGEIRLSNGDMVLNGFKVRISTEPEEGYGMRTGPVSGIYEARVDGDELLLYPAEQLDVSLWSGEIWEPATNDELDADGNPTEVYGVKKTLTAGHTVSVELGYAMGDLSVAGVTAYGEGVTVEILVDGDVVHTENLEAEEKNVLCEWQSDGTELVTVRFSGSGTVVLTSGVLGIQTAVADLDAEFAPVYTLTLNQPEPSRDDDANGMIQALNEGGRNIRDRNQMMDGIQLLEGEKVTLVYVDYDGGSTLDTFTLKYEDGSSETIVRNNYTLTVTQNVTVSAAFYTDELYYVALIPESVEVKDKPVEVDISLMTLKNLKDGETLDVTIKGLDNNGCATIKRKGSEKDMLAVPVTRNGSPLNDNSIVAQFEENIPNNNTPVKGGSLSFGAPQGEKKAGQYTGTVTFTISCQTAGE